ncbi:hypothetical protein [Leekyejoonella antrihumi]|uniref:Signal transduction histidine kinase subgroup 3 dimerisation and phosphoacceptor domain-containing protein n=1 Tax=Leekyejoonella antrihumi TaxID=1660198 RepID=A0A563E6T3_9MICO|nr:hypothetical protein [Leekyejoonella antrihumi]TWP38268.1 hypothetical protein FGL98_03385 [Leekyejoonella antrihumi]
MNTDTRRALATSFARLLLAATLYTAGAIAYGGAAAPSVLVVAAATTMVALTLWATRRPVERAATRIALGHRAQTYQAVHDLLRQMASTVAVDEVVPRLAEAAGRAVGGPSAQVRVWMPHGEQWTQSWPADAADDGTSVRVGVQHRGADVGEIAVQVDPLQTSSFDRRLLTDLAGPAGIALSTVRLTHDLRRRQAELAGLSHDLTTSRNRLLTARRDEQARVRRQVDQEVVRHIESAVALVDAADLPTASRASAEALHALRLIARGIFPPRLADSGLAAALDGWLERADLDARIEIDPGPVLTVPAQICLYFCAVTALGALIPAQPHSLRVRLTTTGDQAVLTVTGAHTEPIPDAVRTMIRDRIEAYDGSATFEDGTVRAVIPLQERP